MFGIAARMRVNKTDHLVGELYLFSDNVRAMYM
jgi:hypothetical protein